MKEPTFKTINVVCLICLLLVNLPGEVITSWLGSFDLARNEAQAGLIEPLDETNWHPFSENAIRQKNPDGSWTANFYQNDRYIYFQDRWQLKHDLLQITVGDNEEIVFSYGDQEFKLIPYVHFHGEQYLYQTLNPIVKEQINLQGEIKENGQKWQHTLNKIL
ncbi:hypothetical protein KKI23_04120, partial [Patescibacteria group bacterium]|nr:hypothetical protein [Patescibacteria group bacterium]